MLECNKLVDEPALDEPSGGMGARPVEIGGRMPEMIEMMGETIGEMMGGSTGDIVG